MNKTYILTGDISIDDMEFIARSGASHYREPGEAVKVETISGRCYYKVKDPEYILVDVDDPQVEMWLTLYFGSRLMLFAVSQDINT